MACILVSFSDHYVLADHFVVQRYQYPYVYLCVRTINVEQNYS